MQEVGSRPGPGSSGSDRRREFLARGLWTDAVVGWALPDAAQRWPDRTALVLGGERLPFRDLALRTAGAAARLRGAGVGAGDRVLIQLPNCTDLVVLVLAAWHLGAVAVPVIPIYREQEMRHILRLVRPTAVAAPARLRGRAPAEELDGLLAESGHEPALRLLVDPGSAAERTGWDRLTGAAEPLGWPAARKPDDPALILFTSGTTSVPKGVVHSSRSLVAEARTYRLGTLIAPDQAVLLPGPVAHVGSLVVAALLPALSGSPTVLLERWDVAQAVRLGAEENVGLAAGAPVFLTELLDRYEAEPGLRRIPRFHTGGAAVGADLIRRADGLGVTAWRVWGMTECPTVSYGGPLASPDGRALLDGRVETGSEVVAVDGDGAVLPPGEAGELKVRGPKLMLGYLAEDGSVRSATDRDGWFATGDLGAVHADGGVEIRGRLKDVINRGGEKFAAAEIEAALCRHPAIAAAAVVGLPDPRLGERVGAAVTVTPGGRWPGQEVLVAHLEGLRLARQKLPVEWRVLPDLPRTATGKIIKSEILGSWPAHVETP